MDRDRKNQHSFVCILLIMDKRKCEFIAGSPKIHAWCHSTEMNHATCADNHIDVNLLQWRGLCSHVHICLPFRWVAIPLKWVQDMLSSYVMKLYEWCMISISIPFKNAFPNRWNPITLISLHSASALKPPLTRIIICLQMQAPALCLWFRRSKGAT